MNTNTQQSPENIKERAQANDTAIKDFEAIKSKIASTLELRKRNLAAVEHEADRCCENANVDDRYSVFEQRMWSLEKETVLLQKMLDQAQSIIDHYKTRLDS